MYTKIFLSGMESIFTIISQIQIQQNTSEAHYITSQPYKYVILCCKCHITLESVGIICTYIYKVCRVVFFAASSSTHKKILMKNDDIAKSVYKLKCAWKIHAVNIHHTYSGNSLSTHLRRENGFSIKFRLHASNAVSFFNKMLPSNEYIIHTYRTETSLNKVQLCGNYR